ncbi:MAG TPA: NADPH-dependent F420 reductase [Acidimicrobiales bacterium]|nr:NADPH-dependent F420 reductase [Acidimicrobiales bacterium]
MNVGILGGTGPAGKALAARLASVGIGVQIGSRQPERAAEVAAQLEEKWAGRRLPLSGVGNETACEADLVVLATPWDGAASLARSLSSRLDGKVLVSMVNALAQVGDELLALVPPSGSISIAVQQAAPGALVAGAFHHLPSRLVADLDQALDADVLVCSDHPQATAATIDLAGLIPGCRGVDAGSLSAAAAIEAFTAVLVGINLKHRVRASIRLTGFDPGGRARG